MAIDFDTLVLGPCHNTFGQTATYKPQGAASFPISVIFDKAYEGLTIIEGQAITEKTPVVGVRISEFITYPRQNDTITISTETYQVREVRDDSHGAAKLMLNGPAT